MTAIARFPTKRVMLGFVLAPLMPVTLLAGVEAFGDYISGYNWSGWEVLAHALLVIVFFTIGCYFISAFFAFPLYVLGWAFLRVNLFACLVCGALIGGGFALVPFVLQYTGHSPMFTSESMGNVALVVDGKFTRAGIANRLAGAAATATFGMTIALAFWLIAVRNNPLAQTRAQVQPERKAT